MPGGVGIIKRLEIYDATDYSVSCLRQRAISAKCRLIVLLAIVIVVN